MLLFFTPKQLPLSGREGGDARETADCTDCTDNCTDDDACTAEHVIEFADGKWEPLLDIPASLPALAVLLQQYRPEAHVDTQILVKHLSFAQINGDAWSTTCSMLACSTYGALCICGLLINDQQGRPTWLSSPNAAQTKGCVDLDEDNFCMLCPLINCLPLVMLAE